MNKETKAIVKKLNKDNRKTLERINVYLGTQHLNEVCYEELMADIAGMALEAQERGENFSDTVGMNIGMFCRELAENTPKKSFGERFFGLMGWTMFTIGIVIPLLWLFESFFPQFSPATLEGSRFFVPFSYLIKYIVVAEVLILGSRFIRYGTHITHSVFMGIYLVLFFVLLIVSDNLIPMWIGLQVIRINVIIWTVVFAVLTLLFVICKKMLALWIAYKKNVSSRKSNIV